MSVAWGPIWILYYFLLVATLVAVVTLVADAVILIVRRINKNKLPGRVPNQAENI